MAVHELFVMLAVRGAAQAIEFYTRVFQGQEGLRLTEPGGRIAHAEIQVGSVLLMLADERPESGFRSPQTVGGTGVLIHLHVDNVDSILTRAVAAGATVLREPEDQGHGERQAMFRDPFGHEWLLGHELERLTDQEIQRRFANSADQ